MRNHAKLLLISLLAAIPLLGWAVSANAQSFRSGDNVTVAANKTVDSTLFASGRAIDIAGTVEGDVFCTGQTITITGDVTGDVICAGQSIRISGTIGGDVRLAGQNVTLGGTVSHNVTVAAQSFTSEGNSQVDGDIDAASSDTILNGQVGRDVAATTGTLTINGQVGRNIKTNVEHLRFGSDANVAGAVEYTSPRNYTKEQGAVIAGQTTRHEPAKHDNDWSAVAPVFAFYLFISLLLINLVLVLLAPRTFHVAGDLALAGLGKTFLIGLLASIVVPIALIALMFTVVGIPLALLGILAWLLILVLSGPFAAYLVGRAILRGRNDNVILTMLLGSAILLILYFIPIIDIIVVPLAMWFGIGMILQRGVFQRPQYNFAHATDDPSDRQEIKTNVRPTLAATAAARKRETTKNPRSTK